MQFNNSIFSTTLKTILGKWNNKNNAKENPKNCNLREIAYFITETYKLVNPFVFNPTDPKRNKIYEIS